MISAVTSTYILTWNPSKFVWSEHGLADAVRLTAAGQPVGDRWSIGVHKREIGPGDRAFLLRQRSQRGIVASGVFTTAPFDDEHWDDDGGVATYAELTWDVVLDPEDRLQTEALKKRVPGVVWDRLQASGTRLEAGQASRLEAAWGAHCDGLLYASPEEPSGDESCVEGTVTQVLVNRYERDRRARQRCIDHWGEGCTVCGFDFAATYGAMGKGFIHVHHLYELSTIRSTYVVDPVADLRPVCPNCHAMLHSTRPATSIAALKSVMRS